MTDEAKPWRDFDEVRRLDRYVAQMVGGRADLDEDWIRFRDEACTRVWREAQVDAAKQDSPALRLSLESHLKHVESRADAAEAQRDRLAYCVMALLKEQGYADEVIAWIGRGDKARARPPNKF